MQKFTHSSALLPVPGSPCLFSKGVADSRTLILVHHSPMLSIATKLSVLHAVVGKVYVLNICQCFFPAFIPAVLALIPVRMDAPAKLQHPICDNSETAVVEAWRVEATQLGEELDSCWLVPEVVWTWGCRKTGFLVRPAIMDNPSYFGDRLVIAGGSNWASAVWK